jgi:Tol biopolymer transport system component
VHRTKESDHGRASSRPRGPLLFSGALAVAVLGVGLTVWPSLRDGPVSSGPQPNGPIAIVAPGSTTDLGVDNLELYLAGPESKDLRNLTQSPAAERDPAWSPDGTRVAFFATSSTREPNGTYSLRDGLYVMRADGTKRREVLPCEEPRCPLRNVAWSPDGTRIAFIRGSLYDTEENALLVMNEDGSGLRTICGFERCGDGIAEPAWSPDGTRIAFSNRDVIFAHGLDTRPSAVFVADADGAQVTRLTNRRCVPGTSNRVGCGFDAGPAWSPDGTTIAFGHVDITHRDGGWRLEVMDVDGSGRKPLAECQGLWCTQVAMAKWSPDGRSIAFVSRLDRPTITLVSSGGGDTRELRTCGAERCVKPSSLIWSPQGDRLAFVGDDHAAYTIGVDGRDLRKVASPVDGCCLAWLPQSVERLLPPVDRSVTIPSPPAIGPAPLLPGLVAFASDRTSPGNDDHFEIYTMRSDGSDLVQLTGPTDYNYHPTWSPDGKQIAFTGWDEQTNDPTKRIFVMNADGTNVRKLTTFKSDASQPDWSPDGSLIAFQANPPRDPGSEVFVMAPNGTGIRRVTETVNDVSEPDWSPDGSMILFTAPEAEGDSLFTVEIATGEIRRVTNLPGSVQDPAWSPDGSTIAFSWGTEAGGGLYLISPDGTGLRRLPGAPRGASASWLPDGSRIVFGGQDTENDPVIYVIEADGTGLFSIDNHGANAVDVAWQPGTSRTE